MDDRTRQDFTRRISQCNRAELIVVRYDIAFSYLEEAEQALAQNETDAYKTAVKNADAVLNDLQATLNFKYELAYQLYPIYTFCRKELMRAMYTRQPDGTEHVKTLLRKLYTAFGKAAEQDTSEPLMHNTQQVYAGMTYGKGQLTEDYQEQDRSRGFFA